jgi:hypothetical protein
MSRGLAVAALTGLIVLAGTLGAASAQSAPTTLRTGFVDPAAISGSDAATWLARERAEGATRIRIALSWAAVAPDRPPAEAAESPTWSGYRLAGIDAQLRAAASQGMSPLLGVNGAPGWAQGAGRPDGVGSGAWKPDVAAFGAFLRALARRYSGTTPDPLVAGAMLPKVEAFQLWNEPNLDTYLAPQWENGKPWAPGRFRELVNAGYDAVKSVQPRATVVTAGLAPFGDYGTTDGKRIPPAAFLRSMLCLNAALKRVCDGTTRFDVLAHHPYAVRKPSSGALNPDDVTIPDLSRLTRVTKAAHRAGTLKTNPGLWVTEVSYDSSAPDPDGVPTRTLARWIPEMLWRLWGQGAETVIWYLVRDQAPTPSFAATYQSGMYLNDGRRKPTAQAFRFPLIVTSRTAKRLKVWFRSPVAGKAQLQVRRGNRWRTVGRAGVPASGVRSLTVPRTKVTAVRAVVGSETSPAWSVR